MSTLPEKWAVEIQSLQDAERLQALFPDETSYGDPIQSMYRQAKDWCDSLEETICFTAVDCDTELYGKEYWGYGSRSFYEYKHGYTILSITELENLLK